MTRASEVAPAWSAEPEPSELTKLLAAAPDAKAGGARQAGRTRRLGLLAIFVLLWVSVAQSEASQALQAASRFNKPFFIVGFDHTITVLLLPLVYLYHRYSDPETRRLAETDGLGVVALLQRHSVLPLRRLLPMAAFLNAFYCFADYFWYAALANVSVAASTAIFNCSPFFVYCFSICFLRERASYRKLAGVLMSFAGVALIALFQDGSAPLDPSALNNGDDGESTLLASVLVVISAAIYGAYEVAFCVVLGDELEDASTLLVLTGLCGLLSVPLWFFGSLAFAWCPIEALHEPLGWPVGGEAVAMLALSGTLAGAYTVLLSLALSWTTPLETAVACMLTIPLAGAWDVAINGAVFSWQSVLGSLLVMAGFGVLECCSPRPQVDAGLPLSSSLDAKAV